MKEINKFYRATMSKDGALYEFRFRADNKVDAEDHAGHCARMNDYRVMSIKFVGREPLENMGAYIPLEGGRP
jgi:hypothetical protein